MGAFKFETIRPESPRSSSLNGLRSELLDKERSAGYAQGFKDGVQVTRDAFDETTSRTALAISEAISDAQLTQEQAAASVFRSLGPLLESILDELSPDFLIAGMHHKLNDVLKDIYKSCYDAEIVVEVSPETAERTRELAKGHKMNIAVVENPALLPDCVDVKWCDGVDRIDLSSARSQIIELLKNFTSHNHEEFDGSERKSG